jgi:hypothetical protein
MKILPLPATPAHRKLKLVKAPLQRGSLAVQTPGCGVFRDELANVVTDQRRKSGIAFYRNSAGRADEIIIERESYIHVPIIRETLDTGTFFDFFRDRATFTRTHSSQA